MSDGAAAAAGSLSEKVSAASVGQGFGDVDCHVHVFPARHEDADRRHPSYRAGLDAVCGLAAPFNIRRFVLTQPSFLHFDNSFLLSVLTKRPDSLRGVIWVAPSFDAEKIAALPSQGVVGLRFPLLYSDLPDFTAYRDIALACREAGLHVELGIDGARLIKPLHFFLDLGVNVVVAHLGMVDAALGPSRDPNYAALLETASSRQLWVKLSAPYRVSPGDAAGACLQLIETFGVDRCVWGSDWPHVGPNLDRETTYGACARWIHDLMGEEKSRRAIMVTTPETLYRFPQAVGDHPLTNTTPKDR